MISTETDNNKVKKNLKPNLSDISIVDYVSNHEDSACSLQKELPQFISLDTKKQSKYFEHSHSIPRLPSIFKQISNRNSFIHSHPKPNSDVKTGSKLFNQKHLLDQFHFSSILTDKQVNFLNRNRYLNKDFTMFQNNSIRLYHKSRRPKWKKILKRTIDSLPVAIFLSLITVFTLISTDLQCAYLRTQYDSLFDILHALLLIIYVIEFALTSIAKDDFVFSFYFWMDLLAIVSIFQDIDCMINTMLGYKPIPELRKTHKNVKSTDKVVLAVSQISRATRAARVLKVVKMMRLVRIVKLYKSVYIRKDLKEKRKQRLHKQRIEQKIENSDMSLSQSKSGNYNTNHGNSTNNGLISECNCNGVGISDGIFKVAKRLKIKKDASTCETNRGNNNNNINNNTNQIQTNNYNNTTKTNVATHHQIKTQPNSILHQKTTNIKTSNDLDDDELLNESRISRIITENINKKVIILVTFILVFFPILSEDFYTKNDSRFTYSLLAEYLSNFLRIYKLGQVETLETVNGFYDSNYPVVNITYNNILIYRNANTSSFDFRYREISYLFSNDATVIIVYSTLKESILTSKLNCMQTLFVCVCLTICAIGFEDDANMLVLQPLEIMTEIVHKVAKDPIGAKNENVLKHGIKLKISKLTTLKKSNSKIAMFKHKTSSQHVFRSIPGGNCNNNPSDSSDDDSTSPSSIKNYSQYEDNYEVNVIKDAIIKIAALLAIGFGEAGGEMLKRNLSSTHELIPKMKGKKKSAIFMFCNIRDFDKINLALEEDTMIFVNEIADIVHSSVDRFKGAINKNIGDSFLSVWKFYNEIKSKRKRFPNYNNVPTYKKDNLLEIDPLNPQINIIADCSVLACLRIILKINKNQNIISYRNNKRIQCFISNFNLTMGFGLHLGYGIEGTIGSSYKIEASYLSPNVNVAARLETASTQFGVSVLISGVLYEKLTDELKSVCRFIDCVKVKGSSLPISLYTIDLNYEVTPQKNTKVLSMTLKEKRKMYLNKKNDLHALIDEYGSVSQIILEKQSYKELIKVKHPNFTDNWENAIDCYRKGDWIQAKESFEKCLEIDSSDRPSHTLLEYIRSYNYIHPPGWEGVRELQSK